MAIPPKPPSDPRWDPMLWSASQMADACVKLGGVLLDPKGKPQAGFTPRKDGEDDR